MDYRTRTKIAELEAEIERLQVKSNERLHAIDTTMEMVTEQTNEIKRLQAVMTAADAFLATPPDDMKDQISFHQYTTAGDCRALCKA